MAGLMSVAKLAGVSRATAARAFSAPTLLRKDTLNKVIAASQQLGFRPNRIAQQLRTQSTHIIGVLVPTLCNPVFAEQLQAMVNVAQHHGYSLLIAVTDYQSQQEVNIVEDMLRQQVDGLIMTVADANNSPVLKMLANEDIPVVLVHNPPLKTGISTIGVDNYSAIYEVTNYLQQLGHRHIGMLTGPIHQSDRARDRYQGYCQAMNHLDLRAMPLIEMPKHTQSSFSVLAPHLQGRQRLTALICSNDLLALSTIGCLMRAGYQVPQQVSIVGFDGIELGQDLFPSLCSVVQPRYELGRQAIASLIGLLSGQKPVAKVLSHYLRLGESISPPE